MTNPRNVAFVTAIALALALGLVTRAAQAATSTGTSSLSQQDREFVISAAEASWAEIAMGKLAQENGSADAVKAFGARMVQDHTLATKELQAMAGKLDLSLSKEPDPKHQGDIKALAQAKGSEFDRLFAGYMVRDHEQAITLFERQEKNGANAALRKYAAKQLPILREHLKLARALPSQR